jgi:glutathione S-transferase
MKIYEYSGFPSPRRVRVFLAEKGIDDIEYEQVDVPGGAARREPFKSKNPLAQVPMLELDDGTCITETTAISRYFEEVNPEPALFGTTPVEKATVDMWQQRLDAGLMGGVVTYFHHATPGLGELETYQNKDWGEKSRERAIEMMHLLNAQLEGKTFVAGENISIADITALCAIDFAKFCEIEVPAELGDLHAWYDRVSARPSATA